MPVSCCDAELDTAWTMATSTARRLPTSRRRARESVPWSVDCEAQGSRLNLGVLLHCSPEPQPPGPALTRPWPAPPVVLTGNDKLYFLRHGGSQPVGGEAAVPALEVRYVPLVWDPEGPRVVGDNDPGVGEVKGLVIFRPRESVTKSQLSAVGKSYAQMFT